MLSSLTVLGFWWQFRSFTDTRSEFSKFWIDYGAGYSDYGSDLDTDPDLELDFWQADETFYLNAKISLKNEDMNNSPRVTTCYYLVPPDTEPVEGLPSSKQPTTAYVTPGLSVAGKFEDVWVYQHPCVTPDLPPNESGYSSRTYGALFIVPPHSVYQTRFDQWVLEFSPIGADGYGPGLSGPDPAKEDLFDEIHTSLATLRYKVDGFGMSIIPYIPASHHVTHQTESVVEVLTETTVFADDPPVRSGTPSVTFTSPNQQMIVSTIQAFTALMLGIVLDRLFTSRSSGGDEGELRQKSRHRARKSGKRR